MADYLFNIYPEGWILIEEQYSDPNSVDGYSEKLSEEKARIAIRKIEEKLGYELLGKNDISPMTDKNLKNSFVRPAGFDEEGNLIVGEGNEEKMKNIEIEKNNTDK